MKLVILPRKDRIQGLLALSVDDALVGLVDIHLGLKKPPEEYPSSSDDSSASCIRASFVNPCNYICENVIAKQLRK